MFRVEVDAKGRSTGVHYYDAGKHEHFQPARAVVLSANGRRLRVCSQFHEQRFEHGLANSSGLVGKYLMFNQGSGAQGIFEHELNEYKSVQVTRILHDFTNSDPKRGFYGGGGIDARINPQPALWALDGGGDLPRWGSEFRRDSRHFRAMASTGHHVAAAGANSVSIDPTLKDAWGIPAIRVTYRIIRTIWPPRSSYRTAPTRSWRQRVRKI